MSKQKLKKIIQERALEIAPKDKPFILKSGKKSDYYLDLRKVTTYGQGLRLICWKIEQMLLNEGIFPDSIGGPETGAIPIIGGLIVRLSPICTSGFWVKKERKVHGMENIIEGSFIEGGKVVLVEDVTTSGDSLMRACNIVKKMGGEVCKAITVVNRDNAHIMFAETAYSFASIFTIEEILEENNV